MPNSIYLINPIDNFPSYYSADVFARYGYPAAAYTANLSITTVAALVPDDFEITLCDEQIFPADLDTNAAIVGITGKCTQVERMLDLAKLYRERGKIVMIGGPQASLCPEQFRSHCDILVCGELEEIAQQVFDDLRAGCWQSEYSGGRADMTHSPIPRWDLYPNERTLTGSVQTSRGCPFECEFCDVIQYVGRKQRHKSIEQVLAELDTLYQCGYRVVFLADDNLTASRHRAKQLLAAIRDWNNQRTDGRVAFTTQLSIDTAKDDEILQLLSEAGPFNVFIGIETPNEESLRETKKRQNLNIDLVQCIERFFEKGICVIGSLTVGFDADGPDIFERQYQFAMATSIPIFGIGALVAPSATPLFERLKREGRLITDANSGADTQPWHTNIIPLQMTRAELLDGIRGLVNRLYHPEAFTQRMLAYIEKLQVPSYPNTKNSQTQNSLAVQVHANTANVIWNLAFLGAKEMNMLSIIFKAMAKKPETRPSVMGMLFQYAQFRYMFDRAGFWNSIVK